MDCQTCSNARRSKTEKTNNWLDERGLAFCLPISRDRGKQQLVSLSNAAGPVCRGKHYERRDAGGNVRGNDGVSAPVDRAEVSQGQAGLFGTL